MTANARCCGRDMDQVGREMKPDLVLVIHWHCAVCERMTRTVHDQCEGQLELELR